MGGWKLEAAKMGLYMFFPVTCFYLFNQADLFEEWTIKMRRELYPHESRMPRAEVEKMVQIIQERKEKEFLKLLEHETQKEKANWSFNLIVDIVKLRNILLYTFFCERFLYILSIMLQLVYHMNKNTLLLMIQFLMSVGFHLHTNCSETFIGLFLFVIVAFKLF